VRNSLPLLVIRLERIQFIVGIPPYETVNASPAKNGWGDQMFLMKYRFAAANADQGNCSANSPVSL
jgi:hypothetical protein